MQPPGEELMELPVKRALFNSHHPITLFIEDNHSNGHESELSRVQRGFHTVDKGSRCDVLQGRREPCGTIRILSPRRSMEVWVSRMDLALVFSSSVGLITA